MAASRMRTRMNPTETRKRNAAMRIDQQCRRTVTTALRVMPLALAAGLLLSACVSQQTADLIDRRVNNVTHVFNLD